jgi:type II secretory pathway pseudopilin PulG
MVKKKIKLKLNDGFTLIEIAVLTLVFGIFLLGTVAGLSPVLKKVKIDATHNNFKNIMESLSIYAQKNNRIPCPANPNQAAVAPPYGFEIGSGANGDQIGNCNALNPPEGIIPFKTLGISEEEILDGWGNYITYRVSPIFTLDPDDPARLVHKRCRVINKWVFDGDNRKPAKARFCCPGAPPAVNTDISLSDGFSEIWTYDRDGDAADFTDSETAFTGNLSFDSINDNITAPAVILVSHGENFFGAFLPNGNRIPDDGTMGLDEGENQDNDNNFIVRQITKANGNNYFLAWRTQDQLYSESGKDTCIKP